MLKLLESSLEKALRSALPADLTLSVGPMLSVAAADAPLVNVAVTRLRLPRKPRPGEEIKPDTVRVTSTKTITGDGQQVEFQFTEGGKKAIVEVETSTGRLARPGDDYWIKVDAKTKDEHLCFYLAPTGEFKVLLKPATATFGYQQRSSCRATIEIFACADQISIADDLLTRAVAVALANLAGIDRFDLAYCVSPSLSLRLLNPRADLRAVERTSIAGERRIFRSTARLALQGELEMTLATDEELDEHQISSIPYSVVIDEKGKKAQTGLIAKQPDEGSRAQH